MPTSYAATNPLSVHGDFPVCQSSPSDGHLGFRVFAVVDNGTVHKFLCGCLFCFLQSIPRSGSYNITLDLARWSHQQLMRTPNSSPHSQTLGIARLVTPSLQWRRSRTELWLSLLNGGVEYFCFLAIFPSLKYSRIFSMSVMCQVLRGADLRQNTSSL